MCKFVVLSYHKDTFSRTLDILYNRFWIPEEIDKSIVKQFKTFYKALSYIIKIYALVFIITPISMIIDPYIKGKDTLPMDFWCFYCEFKSVSPYYQLLYVAQCSTIFLTIISCVAMLDIIYFILIMFAIVQFELIKMKMRSVNDLKDPEQIYEVLKVCVDQHNMILQ